VPVAPAGPRPLARSLLPLDGVRLPHRVIIVRRDQPAVFQAILSGLGRWPTGTSVMWDRRDRIVEWRQPERRAPVESMWHTHGF